MGEPQTSGPSASPAPSQSSAPSQSPTAAYSDYFSPSCSAFAQISNSILESIGLSNPFSYYNCITENLAEAFQQSGDCVTDDIELIITNSSTTTNCTSFETIFDLLNEFEDIENVTDDEIYGVAVTIFESTQVNGDLGRVSVDSSILFNQSTAPFDFENTTDPDIYGCYTQIVTQVDSDTTLLNISDPTCIYARVEQVKETYVFYELGEAYNAKLQTYIVIGSGVAFLFLLVCGVLVLNISSAGVGRPEKLPR